MMKQKLTMYFKAKDVRDTMMATTRWLRESISIAIIILMMLTSIRPSVPFKFSYFCNGKGATIVRNSKV